MLNYAYGVLTARTHLQLIVDGYDPTLGIMHDKKHIRGTYPGFVLDHIEPMRPVVDRAILETIDSETFAGADYVREPSGTPVRVFSHPRKLNFAGIFLYPHPKSTNLLLLIDFYQLFR